MTFSTEYVTDFPLICSILRIRRKLLQAELYSDQKQPSHYQRTVVQQKRIAYRISAVHARSVLPFPRNKSVLVVV